jgi:hypothetical protein
MNRAESFFQIFNRLSLFVFAAIICAWGNSFEPPSGSLDPSWREALVQATDQNLNFGSDIVFTFGPYHQLYTNAISKNLAPLVLGRWIYGIAWGAAALGITELSTLPIAWAITLFMALSGSLSADSGFYALQFTFLLTSVNPKKNSDFLLLALMYSGIVLSIFCKLSFAVSSGPVLLCSAALLAKSTSKQKNLHILLALSAIIIPVLLWISSGQRISGIFDYLFGPNISIVLGYGKAMGINDPSSTWQIAVYIACSAMLIYAVYILSISRIGNYTLAILVSLTSLFLFWVCFKAGMIRHDGHASITGQCLAWFTLITLAYAHNQARHRLNFLIFAIPFLMGLSITSQYFSPLRNRLDEWSSEKIKNTYLFAKTAFSKRAQQKLESMRNKGFKRIKPELEDLSLIPAGADADALPWDISDIPTNNIRYKPRPIIQSYSAYSQDLQQLNKNHFNGSNAPSFIVLKSYSIDGRIPPDLDYPSLETISKKYLLIGSGSKGSLILKRKPANASQVEINWSTQTLDYPISNSNLKKKPWLRIPKDLHPGSRFSVITEPSLSRKIISAIYKPSPIYVKIMFNNGAIYKYRIAESATINVPLYPFVRDNDSLKDYFFALQRAGDESAHNGLIPIAIQPVGDLIRKGLSSIKIEIQEPVYRSS